MTLLDRGGATGGGGSPSASMVGRRAESEAIERALRSGVDGQGSVVFIAGEPGIGKSRLVRETTLAASQRFAVHVGDCFEGEHAMPYRPWLDVLRSMGIMPDKGPASVGLAGLVSSLSETTMAVSDEEADDIERLRLFDGVLSLVRAAAASRPLLLVFEDMHWADPSTIALLRHVARRVSRLPVVLLVTYRSTEVAAGHLLGEVVREAMDRRFGNLLEVRGLSQAEIADLFAENASRPAEPEELAELSERTGGNPYFIEEILRSGREAPGRGGAELPAAVVDVIAYRLARRSAECRALLRSAAILGRTFSDDLVAELADLSEETVARALEEAVAAHLVEPLPGLPMGRHRFVHSLVQEALLATLPAAEARALHLRAAEAIERRQVGDAGDAAAVLARHYRLAHSPAALGRLIVTATVAIQSAADSSGWDEARETFELTLSEVEALGASELDRALFIAEILCGPFQRLAPSSTWLVAVAEPAAEILLAHGRNDLAAGLLSAVFWALIVEDSFAALDPVRALALHERIMSLTDDDFIRSQCDGNLPMLLLLVGRMDELKTAAEALLESPFPAARVGTLIYLGNYLLYNGSITEARSNFVTAWEATTIIPVSEAPVIGPVGAMACGWAAGALWRLRAPAQQAALLERELELRRQPLKVRRQTQTLLGHARVDRGLAAGLSDDFGALGPAMEAWAGISLLWVDFRQGDWGRAIDGMRTAMGLIHREVIEGVAMLSELVVEASRHIDPAPALALIPEWQFECHVPLWRVIAHSLAGIIAAELGDFDSVRRHAEAARASMTDDDWLGLGARIELLAAVGALSEGADGESRGIFDSATATMRRVEHPWDEADAQYVYGKVLTHLGRADEARPHFEASLAILRRIEAAEPFLARVRAAMPAAGTSNARDGKAMGSNQLSERELEVLALLSNGRSNREIATALTISEATVATHVRHILEKTGTANRTEAAALALRGGVASLTNHQH